jgi:hypothetical protein
MIFKAYLSANNINMALGLMQMREKMFLTAQKSGSEIFFSCQVPNFASKGRIPEAFPTTTRTLMQTL